MHFRICRSAFIAFFFILGGAFRAPVSAQYKKPTAADTAKKKPQAANPGIQPYRNVIPKGTKPQKGLFRVYHVKDRWYFDLHDSLFNREMMVTTRYSRMAAGGGVYAGEMEDAQTIIWERGPYNKVLLRVVTVVNMADSTNDIYKAVTNSSLNPIAAAFDIKTINHDSSGVVIDVTDFFKGDNPPVNVGPYTKKRFNLGGQQADKSYILDIRSFPINTEVKVVRTYASTPPTGPVPGGAGKTLPAAYNAGNVTIEVNNSFILLPKVPMARRFYDARVGYFANAYTAFADDQQRAEVQQFIVRWRLEPKPEDLARWRRGELVEPAKPIVYYIDPATPKKWRKYLIQGVNDWQPAFEQAGFKNAIRAEEWPEDSTMSMDDARFSVIRYLASDISNAYGPNVHDPRSGEIIESHIGWYHNVMKLLHNWYMVQAAVVDPRARKMRFDDSLMGELIRFVSSHEIGHTLGLRHNMGSSSRTPVALLRNKAWVEANGHTASIMDYARFNYVAQPEDSITAPGLFPRIGAYDKWAIQWGYTYTGKDGDEDKKLTNKWAIDSLSSNPRLWFGAENNPYDPRSQTEDLGDDAMLASEYGIRNLKRMMLNLEVWSYEPGDQFKNLSELYDQVTGQYWRYMMHVAKNIGGIEQTPKSVEQEGPVYGPTGVAKQKAAFQFLDAQLFQTPRWLLNPDLLNKFDNPATTNEVGRMQVNAVNTLLSASRLNRMVATQVRYGKTRSYGADELTADLRQSLFKELSTRQATDVYRRGMQSAYVQSLIALLPAASPAVPTTASTSATSVAPDVTAIARAELSTLRSQLVAAAPGITDRLTRYHYQALSEQIRQALQPR